MRFDFALALNLAQLVNSVAGDQQPIPCSPLTSQFRTVNYITHGLPQQCLPSAHHHNPTSSVSKLITIPTAVSSAAAAGSHGGVVATPTFVSKPVLDHPGVVVVDGVKDVPPPDEDNDSSLDTAKFLSFDEWRVQNLAKAGQSSEDLGERTPREPRTRPASRNINDLDSLGEYVEIDLNFGFGEADTPESEPTGKHAEQKAPPPQQWSKMAGKTGKERFNYASFDCGATVQKTNPEVQGPYSILLENKDSYMLSECRAERKFVIVELCDDIQVDTVVLANYEFFSSMFKTFRVSVTDRYPKASGWKELGIFEGKNAREIQAFRVENPQIWARYLKIEFLTHYGNEFYCPISLLRVHGSTMMEEFRRTQLEVARGVVIEDYTEDEVSDEIRIEIGKEEEGLSIRHDELAIASDCEFSENPRLGDETPLPSLPSDEVVSLIADAYVPASATNLPNPQGKRLDQCTITETAAVVLDLLTCPAAYTPSPTIRSITKTDCSDCSSSPVPITVASPTTLSTQEDTAAGKPLAPKASTEGTERFSPSHKKPSEPRHSAQETLPKQYPSPVAPPQASPTQDSFYKQIHKRLQLLEANVTLSLQYMEDQYRTLRDAMANVEKRQAQKQATFMENLDATLREELSAYREQYDQLWQSTVIALETHRKQSESEKLAASSRLALLADEVIFQRRMSYIQSILLLLCIALVLFSKSSQLDAPLLHSILDRTSTTLRRFESPPTSPHGLKPSETTDPHLGDGEESDLRIRGGRIRRFHGGIFSSFTRRRPVRQGSIDSVDSATNNVGTSPLSPRPPSPISRSSPATPTGTRAKESNNERVEDGWAGAFGQNLEVTELKAVHGASQSWHKSPSPLGLYGGPVSAEEAYDQNAVGEAVSAGHAGKGGEVRECSNKGLVSRSTVQFEETRVHLGGLPSPSVSPPGSPKLGMTSAQLQLQSSQSQSQSKEQPRTSPKTHKKKKGRKRE